MLDRKELTDYIHTLECALWACRDNAEDILERGYKESMHANHIIDEVNYVLKDREDE